MAEAIAKVSTVVPLKGTNYSTWKVQCRMALMKGLWNIVTKKEVAPRDETSKEYATFMNRYNRALATIVLTVDPTLLYLLGEPDSPVTVWEKLAGQFQKKTWANKLTLRRKLYSLRLKEKDSVHDHIKAMTEIFNELSVIGVEMSEEDRVVHLLASLPDSYSTLVTALEARPEVPKMDTVIEKLVYEEQKSRDRTGNPDSSKGSQAEGAMNTTHHKRKGPRCYQCKRYGHIQRDCRQRDSKEQKPNHHGGRPKNQKFANCATTKHRPDDSSESDSDEVGLIVDHVLTVKASSQLTGKWILDSGATCHICSDHKMFVELYPLKERVDVKLGDGRTLEAVGQGTITVHMKFGQHTRKCTLYEVLYIPNFAYNIISVSKATKRGISFKFNDSSCVIRDCNDKGITVASRVGGL